MAERTEIAWCDSTFNPWIGCTKVGPGCDNCYAEADFDLRKHRAKWGPSNPRSRTSPANWKNPLQWNRQHAEFFAQHGRRRRVFCASLADVFDNDVPDEWRADLIKLIKSTPNLDWLLLTKRIGNVERMVQEATDLIDYGEGWQSMWGQGKWPDHVLLGATICNQEEADRDITKLLKIPARVRFISVEPMLGPVDIRRWLPHDYIDSEGRDYRAQEDSCAICGVKTNALHWTSAARSGIDWVIVGGESGPNARPMHGSWAYDLHDQCEAAGVPFLFKQWGEWVNAGARAFGTAAGEVRHIRSDGTFWNEDDAALQDECADVLTVVRVGKKAAGRDLGGKLHDGYPEAKP